MPRESEIISRLRSRARIGDEVTTGIGDDAAVIKGFNGKDLIVCCDLMVEGVHFRRDWSPPNLLGRKALAVTLSDIAAMGGVPKFAMVSIAIPTECTSAYIDEFFGGLFELAEESGVSIVGGDTSSSRDSLFIDVSVIGECESGSAVTRKGAKVGDTIYVSGSLGGSALGLALLEEGVRMDIATQGATQGATLRDPSSTALLKHLNPKPQLKLGRALGESGLATSMVDISDGLSTDLCHILDESSCGAVIHATDIPIAECVLAIGSTGRDIDSASLALNGGEEYELLFTVRPEDLPRIKELSNACGVEITAIGEIAASGGLQLERAGSIESIQPAGFEHRI